MFAVVRYYKDAGYELARRTQVIGIFDTTETILLLTVACLGGHPALRIWLSPRR